MSIIITHIESETRRQANAFGLLRFISAIAIVLFHYNKLTGGLHTDAQQPWYSTFSLAYAHGGTLVELFFIISGFCFVLFYRDRIMNREVRFTRFLAHRFGRILPSYWLSTLLIVVFGLLSINLLGSTITSAGGSMTNLMLLPLNVICLNFVSPINGVAWFLAVNLICYAWFYIVYYVAGMGMKTKNAGKEEWHIKNCLPVALFMVSIVGASAFVYLMKGSPFHNIARGIASFGVGGGIAATNNLLVRSQRKQRITAVISLLLIAICIFGFARLQYLRSNVWFVEVYILFPAIVFLITNLSWLRELLSKQWMKKLGAYSYTIYIFQTAVMTILYFLLGLAGRNNWYSKTNFLITLVAITGFGIAMYHLWDKPIGDLIKKKEGELHEKH